MMLEANMIQMHITNPRELDWAAFRREHHHWLERHAPDHEVLYRLPSAIIETLARPLAHGRPILSTADREAELAFDTLCGQHYAEGFYCGQPVAYPHLRPPTPPPSPELCQSYGVTIRDIQRSIELQVRNRGYIGRLVTDPTFRARRDLLRETWLALPEAEQPRLPLGRVINALCLDDAVPTSQALTDFRAEFEAFLDRYCLGRMVTWELPDPAGPLLDGVVPWPPQILAARPVKIAVPAHFHLQGSDDLQGLVQNLQRQQTQAAGLDPSCVGPRAAESYAHLFAIDHFRRVADRRYGKSRCPKCPKGYVNRLKEALADHLGIEPEHFRTLHRALTGFQSGKPHTGRWTH